MKTVEFVWYIAHGAIPRCRRKVRCSDVVIGDCSRSFDEEEEEDLKNWWNLGKVILSFWGKSSPPFKRLSVVVRINKEICFFFRGMKRRRYRKVDDQFELLKLKFSCQNWKLIPGVLLLILL